MIQNPNIAEASYAAGLRALAALEIERVRSTDDQAIKLLAVVNGDNPDTSDIETLRGRVRDADYLSESSPLTAQVRGLARLNLGWAVGQRSTAKEGLKILDEAVKLADKPWLAWMRREAEDQIVDLLLIPRNGRIVRERAERAEKILRTSAQRIANEPVEGRQWPAIEGFRRFFLAEMLAANDAVPIEIIDLCQRLTQDACSALDSACQAHTALEVFSWWGHAFVLEMMLTFESLSLLSKPNADAAFAAIRALWPSDEELENATYRYPIGLSKTLVDLRSLMADEQSTEPTLSLLGNWPSSTVPGLLAAAEFGFAIPRDYPFLRAACGQSRWRRQRDATSRQYEVGFIVGANSYVSQLIAERIATAPRPRRGFTVIESHLLDQLEAHIRECIRTGQQLRPADQMRLQWIWQASR